jgi:hypothetical protein
VVHQECGDLAALARAALDELSFVAETLIVDRDLAMYALDLMEAIAVAGRKSPDKTAQIYWTCAINEEAWSVLVASLGTATPSAKVLDRAKTMLMQNATVTPSIGLITRFVQVASQRPAEHEFWLKFVLDLHGDLLPPPGAVDPFLEAAVDPAQRVVLRLVLAGRKRSRNPARARDYDEGLASDLAEAMARTGERERIRKRVRTANTKNPDGLAAAALGMIDAEAEHAGVLAIELIRDALRTRDEHRLLLVTGDRALRSLRRRSRLAGSFGPRFLDEFASLWDLLRPGDDEDPGELSVFAVELLALTFILHGRALHGELDLGRTTHCIVAADGRFPELLPSGQWWRMRFDGLVPIVHREGGSLGDLYNHPIAELAAKHGANHYQLAVMPSADWSNVHDATKLLSALCLAKSGLVPSDADQRSDIDTDEEDDAGPGPEVAIVERLVALMTGEQGPALTLADLEAAVLGTSMVESVTRSKVLIDACTGFGAMHEFPGSEFWCGAASRGLLWLARTSQPAALDTETWEWLIGDGAQQLAEGVQNGLETQIETDRYCPDIWTQAVIAGVDEERVAQAVDALATQVATGILPASALRSPLRRGLRQTERSEVSAVFKVASSVDVAAIRPSMVLAGDLCDGDESLLILAKVAFQIAKHPDDGTASPVLRDIAHLFRRRLLDDIPEEVQTSLGVVVSVAAPIALSLPGLSARTRREVPSLRQFLPPPELDHLVALFAVSVEGDTHLRSLIAATQCAAMLRAASPRRTLDRIYQAVADPKREAAQRRGAALFDTLTGPLDSSDRLALPEFVEEAARLGLCPGPWPSAMALHIDDESWRWVTGRGADLLLSGTRESLVRTAQGGQCALLWSSSLFAGLATRTGREGLMALERLMSAGLMSPAGLASCAAAQPGWSLIDCGPVLETLLAGPAQLASLGIIRMISDRDEHAGTVAGVVAAVGSRVKESQQARDVIITLVSLWDSNAARGASPACKKHMWALARRCQEVLRRDSASTITDQEKKEMRTLWQWFGNPVVPSRPTASRGVGPQR